MNVQYVSFKNDFISPELLKLKMEPPGKEDQTAVSLASNGLLTSLSQSSSDPSGSILTKVKLTELCDKQTELADRIRYNARFISSRTFSGWF